MKKKLLYINTFEPPYRVAFYNKLAEYYDITMLFSQTSEDRTERDRKWFSEVQRNYKCVQLKTVNFFGVKIALEVRQWIKNRDFDLVFIDSYGDYSNMYAIYCLKMYKVPYVFSVDGMLPRPKEKRLSYFIKKYLLSSPKFILSPGESVDKCLNHYGVPYGKIRRFHFTPLSEFDLKNASYTNKEERKRLRDKLIDTDSETKMVLFVGQFIHRKGIDLIIEAAKKTDPNIGYYLVGGKPTEDLLKRKALLNLKNVHFIGFKTKVELAEYYRAADAFLLPTREDIWGLVINEAMAYGLPVITTDHCVAGLELVKNGENGYIIPIDSSDSIVSAINKVFSDDKNLMTLSQNSIKAINDYTSEKMAEDHKSCFDEFFINS